MTEAIKLSAAGLDIDENGEIVLRGVLDPGSLRLLRVGSYQREKVPSQARKVLAALKAGKQLPALDLSMRGGNYTDKHEVFSLHDPVYITDGQQRRNGALDFMAAGNTPRLGVEVHFNKDEDWEAERFEALNGTRLSIAPSVRLRNFAKHNEAMRMLCDLCRDPAFALYDRVSWDQRMQRKHLLTGMVLCKTASALHANHIIGLSGSRLTEIAEGLEKLQKKIGRSVLRQNLVTLWEILDQCWKVREVTIREAAAHLRLTFLGSLCSVLADNTNFWDDTKLVMDSDWRRKLQSFPVADPTVRNLSGSSGKARIHLRNLMTEHLNSGKRTHRLVPVKKLTPSEVRIAVHRRKGLPLPDKVYEVLQQEFPDGLTRARIAHRVGAPPDSVSHALQDLSRRNLISLLEDKRGAKSLWVSTNAQAASA
jgi:hypothetical protein